jgi:NADH-quinone oxidoreductase subunit H
MNPYLTLLFALMFFPGGLTLVGLALLYAWGRRKLVAQLQNRVGPRWFQPLADTVKLLVKEEVIPVDANGVLFISLPMIALAGALTAAISVPVLGLAPLSNFPGDLVVTIYLLSLLTVCLSLAGSNTMDRFSIIGSTRALTQLFSYEAPFLLAILGPAIEAGSWQTNVVLGYTAQHWLLLTQPLGFAVAVIGLMGKLELPPFDAPEAETEIVAGALTEYSGRGYAFFRLARDVVFVIGLTLIAALYLGGVGSPLEFFIKTLALLGLAATLQVIFTRLRIDQTVGLWWRYGTLLALGQLAIALAWKVWAA